MRAGTRIPYKDLAALAEASLQSLGFTYLKNEARGLMEFEVRTPARFRVLVEGGSTLDSPMSLFRAEKGASWLDVLRDLESKDPDDAARNAASNFVRQLESSLPGKPWSGFGFLEGRREKGHWRRLADI